MKNETRPAARDFARHPAALALAELEQMEQSAAAEAKRRWGHLEVRPEGCVVPRGGAR